jgi:hypothetical protein
MAELIGICPVCQHGLSVRELECPHCGLTLRSHFALPPFHRLTPEMTEFLRLFVVSRGNLREMERALGVSYPTVRSKLDQLVQAFEGPADENGAAPPRRPPAEEIGTLSRQLADATRRLTRDFLGQVFPDGTPSAPPRPSRPSPPPPPGGEDEILEQVARGELRADEALVLLDQIRRERRGRTEAPAEGEES